MHVPCAWKVPGPVPVHVAGQSVAELHATQCPLPSHTEPPLSVQAVPDAASVVPQQPLLHESTTHLVAWVAMHTVDSLAAVHSTPPSQVAPPELLLLVVLLLLVPPPVPPVPPVPPLEPPLLGMSERSTEAMISQPVTLAVSAPAATRKAVRRLMEFFMARILRT